MNMNQGIRYLSHGLVAAVAVWGTVTAFAADTTQLDHKDAAFIKDAAQDGEAEVQLGKLAAEKGQNNSIKQLGQHLQQDHTQANQQLMQLAQSKGLTLPTEPARKEERTENRLQDKTGADFDKAFAEHVIKDHEKDIQKFQKALQNCKDADVKAFIEKNLPALRQHLEMARNAGSAVGVDQRILSSADKFMSSNANEGVGTAGTSQSGVSGSGLENNRTGTSTDQNRTK